MSAYKRGVVIIIIIRKIIYVFSFVHVCIKKDFFYL